MSGEDLLTGTTEFILLLRDPILLLNHRSRTTQKRFLPNSCDSGRFIVFLCVSSFQLAHPGTNQKAKGSLVSVSLVNHGVHALCNKKMITGGDSF